MVLGAALVATLLAAFLVARGDDAKYAPLLPEDTTAVLVLDLSGSIGDFRKIGDTLRRVGREDERAGLVVFSDSAYELVPPGSPGRELRLFARFFTPVREDSDAFPVNPWDPAEFRGGTRISVGLAAAREALERDGVTRGSILLASDLDIVQDAGAVSQALVELRRAGIELRIVPLSPLPEHLAFFEQLVGRSAFLAEGEPESRVAAAPERRLGGALPWAFLLVGALVTGLLAVNERLLSRLEVRA